MVNEIDRWMDGWTDGCIDGLHHENESLKELTQKNKIYYKCI